MPMVLPGEQTIDLKVILTTRVKQIFYWCYCEMIWQKLEFLATFCYTMRVIGEIYEKKSNNIRKYQYVAITFFQPCDKFDGQEKSDCKQF